MKRFAQPEELPRLHLGLGENHQQAAFGTNDLGLAELQDEPLRIRIGEFDSPEQGNVAARIRHAFDLRQKAAVFPNRAFPSCGLASYE